MGKNKSADLWGIVPLTLMMVPVLGLNINEIYEMSAQEFFYFTTYELIRREKEQEEIRKISKQHG